MKHPLKYMHVLHPHIGLAARRCPRTRTKHWYWAQLAFPRALGIQVPSQKVIGDTVM